VSADELIGSFEWVEHELIHKLYLRSVAGGIQPWYRAPQRAAVPGVPLVLPWEVVAWLGRMLLGSSVDEADRGQRSQEAGDPGTSETAGKAAS
jgi:hypothetical protein